MNTYRTLSLGLLIAAASSSFAFIVNGSFETGTAYSGAPNIFSPGTPAPWVATTFTPDMYDNAAVDGWGIGGIAAYNNMMSGVVAAHGHRFIGFAASAPMGFGESFGQNVSGLTVNNQYTVTASMITDPTTLGNVQFGGVYDGYGTIDAYFNNAYIGTFAQNTLSKTWQTRSFTFTASATSGFLEFRAMADMSTPVLRSSYMGLDNLQTVPEPFTMVTLGLGLASLIRRRSRRT
ncbi:MAG: hypothetical protein JNK63_00550 [Chthonomonas sp.]|nr:hypothetical protein [Chthonomonas sp.]